MVILCIKLLLVHFVADFLFQPTAWVKSKQEKKVKSPFLYAHIAVHLILLLVVLWFDMTYWYGILFIVISHYIIDVLKLYRSNNENERRLFFVDQLFHLIIMFAVVCFYENVTLNITKLMSVHNLLLFTALVFVTSVSSVFIRMFMSRWEVPDDSDGDSLSAAGKYIGVLERLFVFTFIILNQWAAIGFLLAAKSVFRFGDLSRAKDRKLTEYILIGTLLSFALAIFAGVLYKYLISFE